MKKTNALLALALFSLSIQAFSMDRNIEPPVAPNLEVDSTNNCLTLIKNFPKKTKEKWWSLSSKTQKCIICGLANSYVLGMGFFAHNTGDEDNYIGLLVSGATSPLYSEMLEKQPYWKQMSLLLGGAVVTGSIDLFLLNNQVPYFSYQYLCAALVSTVKKLKGIQTITNDVVEENFEALHINENNQEV